MAAEGLDVAVANKVHIHQIFYNDATRALLDPAFIPLDNTANLRPDWYEFWVIRNFLHRTELEPGAFYGFVSPKFAEKAHVRGSALVQRIASLPPTADAFIVPTAWDQTAYFRNHFEQGEYWHPGLTEGSRVFFATLGIDIDSLVSYWGNAVFSNYVIARPDFWRAWLRMADVFFDYCEAPGSPLGSQMTNYGTREARAVLKAFIQERIATVILSTQPFQALSMDLSQFVPPTRRVFDLTPDLAETLRAMDRAKGRFCTEGDATALAHYEALRRHVRLRPSTA